MTKWVTVTIGIGTKEEPYSGGKYGFGLPYPEVDLEGIGKLTEDTVAYIVYKENNK